MTQLIRQSLVAYGAPLCESVVDCPEPRGTEVLVRVERCGVCHSDLHVQDGYFRLGGDKTLDITKGRALPFTLGHEIAGVVERAGPDATGATAGQRVAVYPWIGCGACTACRHGEENNCAASRHLGINLDGGYASHVLVPHPRYLIDYAPLSPSFAGALMCAGLTAYAALPSGARAVADGDAVPASASLRFRVRVTRPCMLSVLSVDAAGQVSKLYAQEVRGDVALAGGVRLDGKGGPERFFAVCGSGGYDAVEQAARRLGDDVRQKRALPGVQGPQTSFLVEKKQ